MLISQWNKRLFINECIYLLFIFVAVVFFSGRRTKRTCRTYGRLKTICLFFFFLEAFSRKICMTETGDDSKGPVLTEGPQKIFNIIVNICEGPEISNGVCASKCEGCVDVTCVVKCEREP